MTATDRFVTRDERLAEFAQLYVDALAERDSMSPRDAAKAAGARTEAEIAALAEEIRQLQQPDAVEAPLPTPIDPDSERGRWITEQLARNHAAVIARLICEGKPIPPVPS